MKTDCRVHVFVIDPKPEYGGLARMLGGVDVDLAFGSRSVSNVPDLRGEMRD